MATQPTEVAAPTVTEEQMNILAGALECNVLMMPKIQADEYPKSFAAAFREAGIDYLKIEFDGSGDSGSITGIYLDGSWEAPVKGKLYELLENWAYELLEKTGVDWYNNDGGYGEIIFDMTENKFSYEVYGRYTQSNLEASSEEEI